jgi:hypothetical protein
LGRVSYNAQQLCAIFNTPTRGNGLVILAQQLIAAKFNVEIGAQSIAAIGAADGLIGGLVVPPVGNGYLAPSTTSSTNNALTMFNEGSAVCGSPPVDAFSSSSTPIAKTCKEARDDCNTDFSNAMKTLTKENRDCVAKLGCKGSSRPCSAAAKQCNDVFKSKQKSAKAAAKQCRAKAKVGCV